MYKPPLLSLLVSIWNFLIVISLALTTDKLPEMIRGMQSLTGFPGSSDLDGKCQRACDLFSRSHGIQMPYLALDVISQVFFTVSVVVG